MNPIFESKIKEHLSKIAKKVLKLNKNKQIRLNSQKLLIYVIVISIVFDFMFFPNPAFAASNSQEINETEVLDFVYKTKIENTISNGFPEIGEKEPVSRREVAMTAYNSEVGQCDASPCITANGFNVCEHGIEDTVATNALPFGTKIRIPEYFGDRVFVVRDRMNKRYTDRVDIWMLDKQDARKFGVKHTTIEILE